MIYNDNYKNWYGRLGNNIIQIRHAIHLALQKYIESTNINKITTKPIISNKTIKSNTTNTKNTKKTIKV